MAPHIAVLTLALAASCYASGDLPQDDGPIASGRYATFPVIHSTNTDHFGDVWAKRDVWRRGIETLPLANRSDVAYYAKRTSTLNTPLGLWAAKTDFLL